MGHSTIKIGDWREKFVPVNGGHKSGQRLSRGGPICENSVHIEAAVAGCGEDRYGIRSQQSRCF